VKLVSIDTFKSFHVKTSPTGQPMRGKDASIVAGVRKHSLETVEKLNSGTLGFTISTGAVDRDQDMIDVKGWDLAHFQRNPVVLWAHRADELPIGRVCDIGRDDRRLHATVSFLPGGYGAASDLADVVCRLAGDGYLNATSVGFRPKSWDFTDDPDRGAESWFPGIDFHEQELVELSIVCVPSNPEALIDSAPPDIEPGGRNNDSAPVIVPAPVQLISFDRYRRRARAALLGVFPREYGR
jgi:HK97 family phage prohead protease